MAGFKCYNNFHNIDIALFDGVGKYNTPQIAPYHLDNDEIDIVCFDYASTIRDHSGIGVHFYRDDYRFERVWRQPTKYTEMLGKFDFVMTPCFSLYTDYPLPVQLYNHYRSCWLGAYWQYLGMNVIPTVGWSDEASHEWCFDGLPVGGTVSVSAVGCKKDPIALRNFYLGYNDMLERLKPDKILLYGRRVPGLEGNVLEFELATKRRLRNLER